MNIKNLKVGDKVFIKEGLVPGENYGAAIYVTTMVQGWCEVLEIFSKNGTFNVKTDNANSWETIYYYTPEMVDWEKTRKIREMDFKEIIQYGECRKEITKATTYDGREITVENSNEENDIEKAVMMLMLKSIGITYGDVKKEVEKVKVKWVPKDGEKYYWVNGYFEISWYIWYGVRVDRLLLDSGNCFETKKEAEEKLEKIKEVLRGE